MDRRNAKLRCALGFIEVGGYYAGLATELEAMGHQAYSVRNVHPHQNQYPSRGRQLFFNGVLNRVSALCDRYCYLLPSFSRLCRGTLERLLSLEIALRCDVLIFAAGFVKREQLSHVFFFAKLFRRKTIAVFHGSEARPLYLSGLYTHEDPLTLAPKVRQQRETIEFVENQADQVINHPACGQFFKKPYICWLNIGIPLVGEFAAPKPNQKSQSPIVALHCSYAQRARVKGTPQFQAATEKVRAKGYEIELRLLHGVPNHVVLEEIAKADIVLDEAYSDSPMATFACEAATQGKPVLMAGYTKPSHWASDPASIPPNLFCRPEKLEFALERLVADASWRSEMGSKLRNFVSQTWTARQVTERMIQVAEGVFPQNWLYNPDQVDYFHGYGLSESQVKEYLRQYAETAGIEAFQLGAKPATLEKLLEFAEISPARQEKRHAV